MIAIVDYHKGNLKSCQRGLMAAGGDAVITDDAERIAQADAIVLPGVGAFGDAARTMTELGQMQAIRDSVLQGVPFLGICLGLHLMYAEGDEGAVINEADSALVRPRGLGLIPGIVTAMPRFDPSGRKYKIPHVGWNQLGSSDSEFSACPLLEGVPEGEYFYFTHSYIAPITQETVAITEHSVQFPSVVQYNDVAFGVQFHPEKSSDAGARVLRNFVRLVHSR